MAGWTLRGLENITKRYLIHAAAYNLGLIMRALFGHGTPKGMADALGKLLWPFLHLILLIFAPASKLVRPEKGNHPFARIDLGAAWC